jgi:hypothetical protein
MKKRPARTIMELCVARGGVWKGSKVTAFIAQWAIASQAMERPITLAEYGEWWKESRATIYRRQAEFRELFPGLDSPQPIADAAIARADEWLSRGVEGLGSLPADVVPA